LSSTWPKVELADILTQRWRAEENDPIKEYQLVGAHWYAGGLYIKDRKFGRDIQADKLYQIHAGDFVYNRLFAWKGSFALADADVDSCYVSNEFPVFEINNKRLDGRFLYWNFRREKTWTESLGLSVGATPTSRNRLKEALFLKMLIPLPSLLEQRRIVARIEEQAAQINEARTLRQQGIEQIDALFEALVEKRLSDGEKYPEEYLGKLASKIGSGSTPPGGRAAYPSFGIPFIRSLNVRMRRFQWENIAYISPETHNRMVGTRVRPNDVLLNITGASIGRVACAPTDLSEANVNQHVAIIRLSDEIVQPRFLMYWLSQATVQTFINDMQKGATRQGFTKSQIEEFQVPVPPLIEQRRIVAELDALQAEADALKRLQAETAAELDALLPSILDRAFKGEL
jgi:type I restriction enzyme S subunit